MNRQTYHQKLILVVDVCTYKGEPIKIMVHELHINKTQNNEYNNNNSKLHCLYKNNYHKILLIIL